MTALALFQLLDTESGNYVGGYATRSAALESARGVLSSLGVEQLLSLALTHTDENDRILDVIDGQELLSLLMPSVPA